MQIDILNHQKDLKIRLPAVRKVVRTVIAHENRAYEEVAVHFVTTTEICQIHAEFFDDPSPTDCISFPLDDEQSEVYSMLGDIFICPQAAIDYSHTHDVKAYEELTLYIVHGLLHLMGYDDMNKRDKAKMRKAEKRHMENLANKNLILQP